MEDSGALIFSVFSNAAGTLESMELGPEVDMQYSKFEILLWEISNFKFVSKYLMKGLS